MIQALFWDVYHSPHLNIHVLLYCFQGEIGCNINVIIRVCIDFSSVKGNVDVLRIRSAM